MTVYELGLLTPEERKGYIKNDMTGEITKLATAEDFGFRVIHITDDRFPRTEEHKDESGWYIEVNKDGNGRTRLLPLLHTTEAGAQETLGNMIDSYNVNNCGMAR